MYMSGSDREKVISNLVEIQNNAFELVNEFEDDLIFTNLLLHGKILTAVLGFMHHCVTDYMQYDILWCPM